jgi:hypothetical protein
VKTSLLVVLLVFSFAANAASTVYQHVGVITYEYSASSTTSADFSPLAPDRHYTSLAACTAAIANMDGLLPDGTGAPNGGVNIKQNADGICHAVLPYQQSGWRAIGNQDVRQTNRVGRRVDLDIGPFNTEDDCKDAIMDQQALTVQNGPISGTNIGYSVHAKCVYVSF